MTAWPLRWSHGHGFVEKVGAMLGPVHFQMPCGHWRQPFAVFPWADEPTPVEEKPLHGLMARGRGEWPCVPFGMNPNPGELGWDHPIHGHSAHGNWQRLDDASDEAYMHLAFEYPEVHKVCKLERQIWGIAGEATIQMRLTVHVRETCRLPIGLHFTFKMPSQEGTLVLEPSHFAFAQTCAREVETGFDMLEPGQRFATLEQAPCRQGGKQNVSRFPLKKNTESLFQICGVEGNMVLHHRMEGYRVVMQWDTQSLPSCLVWISNAGRRAWPWRQQHFALGVEPVCAYFDEGVMQSTQPNPVNRSGVPTCLTLIPGRPFTTDYRVSLHDH
jgi:hypothetical protein